MCSFCFPPIVFCLFLSPLAAEFALVSQMPCQRQILGWGCYFRDILTRYCAACAKLYAAGTLRMVRRGCVFGIPPYTTTLVAGSLRMVRSGCVFGIPPYTTTLVAAPHQWGFARTGTHFVRPRGGSCAANAAYAAPGIPCNTFTPRFAPLIFSRASAAGVLSNTFTPRFALLRFRRASAAVGGGEMRDG